MFIHKKDVILRFKLLVIFIFSTIAIIILAKAVILMTLERQWWLDVAQNAINKSETIEPKRGDILSANGELLVSNLVRYRLYLDFENLDNYNFGEKKKAKAKHRKDSIWNADLDSLCIGLADIFPEWNHTEFKTHIKSGQSLRKGNKGKYGRRRYPLCPDHTLYISYPQYRKIQKLPILRSGAVVSGLSAEEHKYRKKFFGSLANSTLGDYKIINIDKKSGTVTADKHGLDEKYDSLLSGSPGLMRKEKEHEIIDKAVEHGYDIQTTLDVEMLDICEKALRNNLERFEAHAGWAILMEVKSGDIKAIVNLSRNEAGDYEETFRKNKNNATPNHAIADLREPGSIFKPIALSIALEDGLVNEHDSVEAHKHYYMHGRTITDAVTPKRKYQTITEVIQNSSNVGMALIINRAYEKNPKRFTDRLAELGMKENYYLLCCERTPTFRTPASAGWSKPDLQAMSRGYATAQTAVNMITFYNGIANGGVRMAPRLVKAILKNGDIVEEIEPKVLDKKMLSKSTVETITRMLTAVVNEKGATGWRAKSEKVSIAGKTGTALNKKEGNMLSFCGFFPVENPEYTCIVQIINNIGGGGSTSAVIFKEIAENIMANSERCRLEAAIDTIHPPLPGAKRGNMTSVSYILDEIDIDAYNKNISDDLDDPTWGVLTNDSTGSLILKAKDINNNLVPDVIGMGAKDAIYLMTRAGLEVTITGHGKVTTQSVAPGHKATRGRHVRLTLKP